MTKHSDVPEHSRRSGEQAEERTAREGREHAETQLLDELGLSFHRVGNSLQVTLFEPFKIESLVPADKSYTAHFAMDKAWKKLIEKQAECSRLASRVEGLEGDLNIANLRLAAAHKEIALLARAHAEEKGK